jgi:hypothetical protein
MNVQDLSKRQAHVCDLPWTMERYSNDRGPETFHIARRTGMSIDTKFTIDIIHVYIDIDLWTL